MSWLGPVFDPTSSLRLHKAVTCSMYLLFQVGFGSTLVLKNQFAPRLSRTWMLSCLIGTFHRIKTVQDRTAFGQCARLIWAWSCPYSPTLSIEGTRLFSVISFSTPWLQVIDPLHPPMTLSDDLWFEGRYFCSDECVESRVGSVCSFESVDTQLLARGQYTRSLS